MGFLVYCCSGISVQSELKLSHKTYSPHEAKAILLESDIWVTNSPQYPRFNVLLSFIRVNKLSFRLI